MKRILLMLGMTISFALQAASTPQDVQRIYNRLIHANPGLKVVSIEVRDDVYSWCSEACNMGNKIIVTSHALGIVANEDELAGIIGHEEGHFVYKNEMDADLLGLHYAAKAGYNYCKAAQLLKRYAGDKLHPVGAIRYSNTHCP